MIDIKIIDLLTQTPADICIKDKTNSQGLILFQKLLINTMVLTNDLFRLDQGSQLYTIVGTCSNPSYIQELCDEAQYNAEKSLSLDLMQLIESYTVTYDQASQNIDCILELTDGTSYLETVTI